MRDHRDAAIAFLLEGQGADGAWRDFDLEPGASDSWLTAFVALVLVRTASVPTTCAASARTDAVRHAVDFLMRAARVDSLGLPRWGYNARVPVDADSTAHVALLLHATGHGAAGPAGLAVEAFSLANGGVATFRRSSAQDTWGHAHADVTAVAVRALRLSGADDAVVDAATAHLRQAMTDNGLWRSYWWTTDWFATAAVLRAYRALGVACDLARTRAALHEAGVPAAPFDAALLLALLRLTGEAPARQAEVVRALVLAQLEDGSWPSVPRLRVTDASGDAEARERTGPTGRDQHRLYTTATVLHALARVPAP